MPISTVRKVLLRPLVAIPAVSLLIGGGVVINSQTGDNASAQPQKVTAAMCSISVPSRVEVDRPSFVMPISKGADCQAAGVTEARWDAKQADGSLMEQAVFRFTQPYEWVLLDFQWLGAWTWHPAGAKAPGDPALARKDAGTPVPGASDPRAVQEITIPQNTPKTDIRSKSIAYISPSRPANSMLVTINTTVTRYAQTTDGFIGWGGAKGQIQWKRDFETTWKPLKDVTADANGKYSWSYTATGEPGSLKYRVYYPSVQYIFGGYSPASYLGRSLR